MSLYGATRSAIPQPVLTAVYAATGLPREQKKRDYEAKLKDRFKEAPEVTAKPFSFFFFAIPPDFFACGSDAGSCSWYEALMNFVYFFSLKYFFSNFF